MAGRVPDKAVFDAAASLSHAFGPLTGIVNDAIFIRYGPVEGVEEEVLDRMLEVGIKGAIWGVQALLAHRGDRPASVVNLASPVADLGTSNTSSYTAVKGAIVALTRQLAVELAPHGFTTAAVAPGLVETPLTDFGLKSSPAEREAVINQIPVRKIATVEDVAWWYVFLASDRASYSTGSIFTVDGGLDAQQMALRPVTEAERK